MTRTAAAATPLTHRLAALARPLVVAHRGLSSRFPENTLPAFEAAIACGAELIELDVHTTRDGAVVCIHDETLDRTTDARAVFGRGDVAVADVDAAQIARLDAGSWRGAEHAGARVPTLEATVRGAGDRIVLMIEHKRGDPALLVAELRRLGVAERVFVQSFDWDTVAAVGRLAPEITLGALGEGELSPARLAAIDALGVALVHWHHRDLRLADLGALHARGYLSCVYTADGELELFGRIRAGLGAVTTNRADHLLALRRAESGLRPTPR
ncbi:MAG: glycerophosphodiester phosphodiesterase [Planctomycetes bacterium]|nr:glycerophosphodiester phosphodiesterase [Planctomycetota bacterium]